MRVSYGEGLVCTEPTETPTTDSPPTEPELKKATDEL